MTALASSKGSGFAGEAVDITSPNRNYELINALQKALNEDNVIALKRIIRTIIWDFEQTRVLAEKRCEQIQQKGATAEEQQRCLSDREAANQRKMALLDILFDLESFHNFLQQTLPGLPHRHRFYWPIPTPVRYGPGLPGHLTGTGHHSGAQRTTEPVIAA